MCHVLYNITTGCLKVTSKFCLVSYNCDTSPHQVINITRQCIVTLPILINCIMRMYYNTKKKKFTLFYDHFNIFTCLFVPESV